MKRIPLYILLLASLNGFSKEINVKGFSNNPHLINNQNTSYLNSIIPSIISIEKAVESAVPPTANNVNKTICDDDGVDDGQKLFDLTSLIPDILGPVQAADPTNFDVSYYTDAAHTSPISDPTSSAEIHIYVEVTDKTTSEKSSSEIFITVVALPAPVLTIPPVCFDNKTGIATNSYIISGYTDAFYDFEWRNSDGNLVNVNPNSTSTPQSGYQDYSCDTPGDYTLFVKAKSVSNCDSGIVNFTVKGSAKPVKVTFTTSGWFSDNQTITVNADPYIGDASNFLYSLDGKPAQVSNVFTNVNIGPHEVTVSDVNGCGSVPLPIDVPIVFGPKSFTPNGDGINDKWNVLGLEGQKNSELYIFDRYGKLIIQLDTNGDGWDGTLNGYALPATDYWYKINYIENGNPKEFKSHFSLIR